MTKSTEQAGVTGTDSLQLRTDPHQDTGVLLLQMGGPATLKDVRRFLFRMLSDPAILAMPGPIRLPLAGLIALLRAPKVRKQYGSIGGGSPIVRTSLRQASALAEALEAAGHPLPVVLGNRYVPPTIREAVRTLADRGVKRLLALPLYPQYSETTTGSAFREVRKAIRSQAREMELLEIRDYADHSGYAAAVAETLNQALGTLSPEDLANARILFSAHGLPVRYVEAGDPYPERVAASVDAVLSAAGTAVPDHATCFQSRVGPVEWLSPSTEDSLAESAQKGVTSVIMVPISFVSDHLETLYEMDRLYRDLAARSGIGKFVRVPALNESRTFINALTGIVLTRL